jgi:hypothetical protein
MTRRISIAGYLAAWTWALWLLWVPVARSGEDSAAAWIKRMNDALLGGQTLRAEAFLETRDHQGNGEEIAFDILRRAENGEIRSLVAVESPPGAAGTLYEVIERTRRPPERWIYTPWLDRLRKLVGFQWTDSFLGTEFTFEDLELAPPAARGRGTVERVVREDQDLVQVTSAPYAKYSKVVTLIDPTTALPVWVEFFDSGGSLWKTLHYEWVAGRDHPLPDRIVLNDVQTQATSTLTLRNVRTGIEVPWSQFSERETERRQSSLCRDTTTFTAETRRADAGQPN